MTLSIQDCSGPHAFRWRVVGDAAPLLISSLAFSRAARSCIMRTLNQFGVEKLPDSFHHGVAEGRSAYWLPEDVDDDGVIDHLLVFHRSGIPFSLLPGLAAGGEFWMMYGTPRRRYSGRLFPIWMGDVAPGGPFGPARRWVSVTPFVTTRGIRPGRGRGTGESRSLASQISRLLVQSGWPEPVSATSYPAREIAGQAVTPTAFISEGTDRHPFPPGAAAAFLELTFAEPIWGPLAIGYGAHNGLGHFLPADQPPAAFSAANKRSEKLTETS